MFGSKIHTYLTLPEFSEVWNWNHSYFLGLITKEQTITGSELKELSQTYPCVEAIQIYIYNSLWALKLSWLKFETTCIPRILESRGCEKIWNITEYLTYKMHLATVTNYVLYQHNITSQTNIAVTRMDASYSTVQMHFLILCTYTDILWHIICVAWLASFKLKDSAMEDWGLLFLFHS